MGGTNTRHGRLDPADWPDFSRQAHALLDDLLRRLEGACEGPVWRPVPDEVKQRLIIPCPDQPADLAGLLSDLGELILPYGTGNTHPRFWGWVHGGGTPGGLLAEMAAAALNANCGGRDHVAITVERLVVDWAKGWFGFPAPAGGLLVGGTSMANLMGLAVARHHHCGPGLRADGLQGRSLVAYASAEAHMSSAKAFELMGLGHQALRKLPVDEDFRLDMTALAKAVDDDRRAGFEPFAVIASAGTVNTGAIDPLAAMADFCRDNGLWLHVDGAFGALLALVPALAPRLAGLERADSLAFDFHKWLHVPYDAGCLLVRDAALQKATFGGRPDYLAAAGGLAGGDPWPCDLGIELSRGFKALKVWFTIREQGTTRLGEAIAANCAQARFLGGLVDASPRLERMAPVSLNIVCFRYRPDGWDDARLDGLNAALVVQLHLRGIAVPSTCRLQGRLAIRVCITNHRSEDGDFQILVRAVEEIGGELSRVQAL